jgi:MFS family permease
LLSTWPALRHRNFRLFIVGQLISLTGTWMQSAAQLWLVYRLTGSSWLLGVLGFATQIPVFVLGPLGGLVSDTHDRHRVLLWTQATSMLLAFLLAGLTLSDRVRVWHLVVIALLLGGINAFDIPSRQAFLTDMVGREDLMNAVALNSSMFHSARMLGPALGGLAIAAVGEGWCFFLNGVSFLAVLAALLAMRRAARAPQRPSGSALGNMLETVRLLTYPSPVRSLLLLLGLVSLAGTPYSVLLPIFAERILQVEARGLGLLMGAAGLGALAAALLLSARWQVEGLRHWVGRSAALTGASLLVFSQSRAFWLSVAVLVAIGFGVNTQLAATNALLQRAVSDALRGRVMSVYAMMFMGMMPIGALLAGALTQRLGASWTVAAGGFVCLLGAGLFELRPGPAPRPDSVGTATPPA